MDKKVLIATLLVAGSVFSTSANAAVFTKYGYIKRVLTEQYYYSGCMVLLDTAIGNSCRSSWVSLDCSGLFYNKDKEKGAQMLSNAMAAAHAGKRIQLYIDNALTVNGYCVARRLDTLF